MRGRPGVVEHISIDTGSHAINPFRVRKLRTFSALAISVQESSSSIWAGLSTYYSTSPPAPTLKSLSKLALAETTDMTSSTVASTSAYGLFEIAPFHHMASQLSDGSREPASTAVISHTVPRANFDTFGSALLSVVQILTMTDWQYIMYDATRTNGNTISLYFYLLLFLGNYVLMNLFVAIVVVGFANQPGQLEIIERDNRDLAQQRFKFMRLIKESCFKQLSLELCAFPGILFQKSARYSICHKK